MALPLKVIEDLLRHAFEDAVIQIQDLAGDQDHYHVTIFSDQFTGKNRVQQHQMVYKALQGKMGHDLHAMALKTGTLSSVTK